MSRSDIPRIDNSGLVINVTDWMPSGSANYQSDPIKLSSPYVGYMIETDVGAGTFTGLEIQFQGSPVGTANWFNASGPQDTTVVKLGGAVLASDERHCSTLTLGANGRWAPLIAPYMRFKLLTTGGNTASDSTFKIYIAQAFVG